MKTWYLFWLDGHEVIDEQGPADGAVVASCEARSWVEAKYKLGFDLTPLQQRMLAALR